MGLPDVAGIFSRKFIIGFFVPVFFVTLAWAHLVDEETVPVLDDAGTQVLIIGGFAVLIGLLLSGLHYSMIRFLEGYWLLAEELRAPPQRRSTVLGRLIHRIRHRVGRRLTRWRLGIGRRRRDHWIARRAQLCALDELPMRSPSRTNASRELHEHFPADEARVLPTRFGNVVRAFETHPRRRYGLDGIAAWPRVASLLTEAERAELDEATTDLAFWINLLVMVCAGGLLLFAERLWHRPGDALAIAAVELAVIIVTVVLAAWMLRRATAAAARWGLPVRAGFDVHRLELYEQLGLKRPASQHEEEIVARAVGRLVAFAEPIPDDVRAVTKDDQKKGTTV
jgi:hypothetical protein